MPRLLVIDDDVDLRMAVSEYLTSLGYEVHEAAEREEAEALLEHYAYSLVITDLSLTTLGVERIRFAENSCQLQCQAQVDGHERSHGLRAS